NVKAIKSSSRSLHFKLLLPARVNSHFSKINEIFEKCSILFKFKEGENFNRRNTLSILRIKI
ncbi:MAG: hypothetical protein V3S72_06775, partial [Desulfobacterales bacterium]